MSAGWVVIRVDGSTPMGIGHVMRCLTLANAFARRGIGCVFVCRHLDGSLPEWLRGAGHEVIELREDGPRPAAEQGGYGHWLGTTQAHDAESMRRALVDRRQEDGDPQLVLVDHYGLDREWEKCVVGWSGVPIAVVDDLDREHECDFLVDTTYGKTTERYFAKVPTDCVVMVGAEYALLRPGFAEIREGTLARRDAAFAAGEPVRNLLVSMGGADPSNATAWTLEAIRPLAIAHGFETHVLVGAAYPHDTDLRQMAADYPGGLTIHRDIADVAGLLAQMDLCIGAAGSSSWERCCLGLPTINVVLADNQREIAAALAQAGAVADGGHATDAVSPMFAVHAERLLADSEARQSLSYHSRAICDGLGTDRVLRNVLHKA